MPYVTNDGARIFYSVTGKGLPLVLHTAFASSIDAWYRMGYVSALEDDYQLVMIDPRGQGKSDKPHEMSAYRPEQRVRDVLAVMDNLDILQAHFLGYSMGGRVGYDLGVRAGRRFWSLTIGGQHPFGWDPGEADRMATGLRDGGMEGFVTRMERGGAVSEEQRKEWLANDAEALAAIYLAMGAAPSLEASLVTLVVPTLIFCGEKDGQSEGAARAATLMPRATFVELPGLDHGQAARRPDLVVPHVRALHRLAQPINREVQAGARSASPDEPL